MLILNNGMRNSFERNDFMDLEIKNNCLIVSPTGELDSHYADLMRDKIDATAKKYGLKNIIINLKNVAFMDSSGIGLIVGRYKFTTRRGGVTAAAQAPAELKKLLVLSGLHRIITVYDNIDDALKSIERSH